MLSDKLSNLRKKHGLTQEELALELFISRSMIAKYETGKAYPTNEILQKIADYFWHITLPTICIVIGGIASLTMLTKNSFMDELSKQYVLTARAKGVSEKQILYHHIFRNAMLIIIAGIPALLIKILFTGSLLIEIISKSFEL